MDWPCTETCFNDNDFRNFRMLRSEKQPICWDIESGEDLTAWIDENESSIESSEYGTFVIIFSRGGDLRYSSPSYLPVISRHAFSKLIELFHIYPAIVRTIRREITYFSRIYLQRDRGSSRSIAYTARMSSIWPDDIAMSSVYLCDKRLNLSVFYGCNEEQSYNIERRLAEAGKAIYYPMLAAGILIELDRSRLVKQVESILDPFALRTDALCRVSQDPDCIIDKDGERTDELLNLYNNTRELVKGIRKVKRQILDMCRHIQELEDAQAVARRKRPPRKKPNMLFISPRIGTQNRERLTEIDGEYDEKLEECQMVLDSLGFTTQMAADHVARRQTIANTQIAIEMKQESVQMRSIALVTMVYLPLTSVASIFSMGVFNWGASGDQSILTFYFWVYIAVAGTLTILTFGLWWVLTRAATSQGGRNTTTNAETLA